MEMLVLTTMSYGAIHLFKKVSRYVDTFEKWFTEDRGTGASQNGWVGGEKKSSIPQSAIDESFLFFYKNDINSQL